MSVAVSGTPANGDSFDLAPSAPSLSVFDTLDRAIAGLNTNGRTVSQVVQANAESLRDVDAAHSPRRRACRCRPGAQPDRQ
jgi:flagellar hook-associated protein 3 FlgL